MNIPSAAFTVKTEDGNIYQFEAAGENGLRSISGVALPFARCRVDFLVATEAMKLSYKDTASGKTGQWTSPSDVALVSVVTTRAIAAGAPAT